MEARKDAMNLDANESAFFKRQLEHVKAQSYDVKWQENKALALFPVDSSAGPAATEITWRQFTRVGLAKMVSDYASDFPRVDVYGTENTIVPHDIGAAYGYSIQEIRRAQMAGFPLETRRAEAARRAIEDKINTIAFSGDSATNLKGFIGYTGITAFTLASGTGGYTWATKTSDEILTDMNGLVNAVVNGTNGVEQPDTMLLPLTQYNNIATKRLGTNSDTTVLEYFLKTNQYIKKVLWLTELATGNVAGTGTRAMVFKNDAEHVQLLLPVPFEQFDYDKEGMAYTIPCLARIAGIVIYYPASVAYLDSF
jgi:hypothetical protein